MLKIFEVLSANKCSRTCVDKYRFASPICTDFHLAYLNQNNRDTRSDLDTYSLIESKSLSLKEENANCILIFLQYLLTNISILPPVILGSLKYGSLKYRVEISVGEIMVRELRVLSRDDLTI